MEDKEKREAAGRRPTVDVIIPVYKPDKKFSRLLKMLSLQTYPVGKIIVMNTEKAYWKDEGFQGIPGLEVHHLTKQEFDHGATRNRGAKYSRADIIVFMTDDAVPADRELIGNLAAAFSQRGPQGESVIMAYARQLPCDDCSLAEQYTEASTTRNRAASRQRRIWGGWESRHFSPPMSAARTTGRNFGFRAGLSTGQFLMRT